MMKQRHGNEVISFILGGIIGGVAALGQRNGGVIHILIILGCVLAFIVHMVRMKEED